MPARRAGRQPSIRGKPSGSPRCGLPCRTPRRGCTAKKHRADHPPTWIRFFRGATERSSHFELLDGYRVHAMRGLVVGDFVGVFEREADIVQPIQQAVSPEWLDVEGQLQ